MMHRKFFQGKKIQNKILLPFIGLTLIFAIILIIRSTSLLTSSIEARVDDSLYKDSLLVEDIFRQLERKVAFYAQSMSDMVKMSEKLQDAALGRSMLIYLLGFFKQEKIESHLFSESTAPLSYQKLVRKGLLGLRTTALIEDTSGDKRLLKLAAVAPVEKSGGIADVVLISFNIDREFLETIKAQIGSDITIIFSDKVIISTENTDCRDQLENRIKSIPSLGERKDKKNSYHIYQNDCKDDPHKVIFYPLVVAFKREAEIVLSTSLKDLILAKKKITYDIISAALIVMFAVIVIYSLIIRKFINPIKELKKVTHGFAEGKRDIKIQITSRDEVGDLADSFQYMIDKLSYSEKEVLWQMNQLTKLYKDVSEERKKFSTVLSNLSDGVLLLDDQRQVILMNTTAERWLGVREGRAKGIKIAGKCPSPYLESLFLVGQFKLPDSLMKCWEYYQCSKSNCPAFNQLDLRCWLFSDHFCHENSMLSPGEKMKLCTNCQIYLTNNEIYRKDHDVMIEEIELSKPQPMVLRVSSSLILEENGRLLGQVKVLNDVTEEREISRMKSEFVSMVSHELRTPLTSIKAYTEILMRNLGRDKKQQAEFLGIINDESDRLTRLINDILDISRIESKLVKWEKGCVDLAEAISSSVMASASYAQKKGVEIIKELSQELKEVWADRDPLKQVLSNLINNAIKFTGEGGRVTIKARNLDEQDPEGHDLVLVAVADTGIGIPEQHRERVFEKFFQLNSPQQQEIRGTGLGLFLCREIIHRFGGKIWVESALGQGSVFYFTLTCVPANKEVLESEAKHHMLSSDQGENLSENSNVDSSPEFNLEDKELEKVGERVAVIADDQADIRRFLKHFLTEEGFSVQEAENGKEALDLIKIHKPSLILLDYLMPEMSGAEVLDILKSKEETRHIPVIVLSGYVEEQKNFEMKKAIFLLKPFSQQELLAAVHEALRQFN